MKIDLPYDDDTCNYNSVQWAEVADSHLRDCAEIGTDEKRYVQGFNSADDMDTACWVTLKIETPENTDAPHPCKTEGIPAPLQDGDKAFVRRVNDGLALTIRRGEKNVVTDLQLTGKSASGASAAVSWLQSEKLGHVRWVVYLEPLHVEHGSFKGIQKMYHVEAFDDRSGPTCDREHPSNKAVNQPKCPTSGPAQTGSGTGGEPPK